MKAGTPVNIQNERGFSPLILEAYHGASAERRDASGCGVEDWARTQEPEAPVAAPRR